MTDTAQNIGVRNRLMVEVRCEICRESFGDAKQDICDFGSVDEHTFVIDKSTVPKDISVSDIVVAIDALFGVRMASSWLEQLSEKSVCSDYD